MILRLRLLLTLLVALTQGDLLAQEGDKPVGDEIFQLEKVLEFHIELTAEEFQAMQPPPGGGFGVPGAPMPPQAPNDQRERETNQFGTRFAWVKGKVTGLGKTVENVGLRYAGDITYLAAGQGAKRPFLVSFDKYEKNHLDGITTLNFHSMPLDPLKGREFIGLNLFREMGGLAPRVAFAEVKLSVPGRYDQEYLGLYTLVESIDLKFLKENFGSDQGFLMKPQRMRGIDFLGEDWTRYTLQYTAKRGAKPEESQRVIEFAKLINQASEAEFQKNIESYLDIDSFLRFSAANAILTNLESFQALGTNYNLYLDRKSQKFYFIAENFEFAFANFLLFGTPDQLMDLSLIKPYPGENKLIDRLMAKTGIKGKYLALVQEMATKVFTKEKIIGEAERVEKLTSKIREQEAVAQAARREPPGFGPPPGGPQAPNFEVFVEKRLASIEIQLQRGKLGFVPQPLNFGPPAGGGGPGRVSNEPINEATFREVFKAPEGFDVTLYGAPPKVNSPVAISAGPSREIYVAVDLQGSLGRTPGGGKILRCRDEDGNGKVDEVTEYAKVEHPRGVVYRAGTVWVMHPPNLSIFHDDDGDGVADRQEVLVTGLTTNQIDDRGGDHTTNGIRLGIDGWLYIGVGDYGIKEAKAKDGSKIVLRGGGIARVQPDGTELEIFCMGLRNPFDIAIDPFMNLFTRDNTNDGAGWDIRVSHLMQGAQYGYTQLFANFTDETMPTLGTFGGGGGTGGIYLQDSRWPEEYQNRLYTGDWGRSEVYRHDLTDHDPTFDLKQEVFLTVPRATGMDLDADGYLYVASWRGGDAAVDVGPNVGFVARVSPKGHEPAPFPDLNQVPGKGNQLQLEGEELVDLLRLSNAVGRFHVQGEILRRGADEKVSRALDKLCLDPNAPEESRTIALFTRKQLDGIRSHEFLLKLIDDPVLKQFALKALTDRKSELKGLDPQLFVKALKDESPRVRGQAAISLARLGDPSVAKEIIPLLSRPEGSKMPTLKPVQNQPDPDRVVPHLAARALIALNAIDPSLEAVDGPHSQGALLVLRSIHDPLCVEGLIKKLNSARESDLRRGILIALIRLYHKEEDYTGSWWGIRPDNTGPYYDRVEWKMSKRIGTVIMAAFLDSDPETAAFLKKELVRHQVSLEGIPEDGQPVAAEEEKPIVVQKADPNNPDQIGNLMLEQAARRTLALKGNAAQGKDLFRAQSCIACHTEADGQTPKGPHLVDIGKRYKAEELVESILQPSAKFAQGYETYTFSMSDGLSYSGFVVSESSSATKIREQNGVQRVLKKSEIEDRVMQKQSVMPEGIVGNLTPAQLADLIAYLQSLDANSPVSEEKGN